MLTRFAGKLSKPGDSATLRLLFAKIRVSECYGDITPTDFWESPCRVELGPTGAIEMTRNGNYTGKLAFVTGAGSGISRATAMAFAHESASVAVADVSEKINQETARFFPLAITLLYAPLGRSQPTGVSQSTNIR
jgi:hypothetical protein